MNRLITHKCPQKIIDAYRTNPLFSAIVIKNEMAGSDYKTMMEDAVYELVKEIENRNRQLVEQYESGLPTTITVIDEQAK